MKIDLIEQLGGYEKAKEMHTAQLKAGLAPYGYEEALLQYRREHNIFEVGDKVVIKNKPQSSNRLHVILRVENSRYFIAPIHGDLTMHMLGCMASDFYLRHAEPKEIQAGGRLEVCGG